MLHLLVLAQVFAWSLDDDDVSDGMVLLDLAYSPHVDLLKCKSIHSSPNHAFSIFSVSVLPLNNKRLLILARVPGGDLDNDANGEIVLLADFDDAAHPYFYCTVKFSGS